MQASGENSWADGAILRRVSQNCLLGFSGAKDRLGLTCSLPSPVSPPLLPLFSLTAVPCRGCRGVRYSSGSATSHWNLGEDETWVYEAGGLSL